MYERRDEEVGGGNGRGGGGEGRVKWGHYMN